MNHSFPAEAANGPGTLSAESFKVILDGLKGLGVDADAVMAASRFDRALFDVPLARVDAEFEHEFWAKVEKVAGDPAIGLTLGTELARRGNQQMVEYLASHSGTLRRMVENTERFLRLLDDRGHVQLFEDASLATVRIHREGYRRPPGYIDMLFAFGLSTLKRYLPGFRLLRIEFRRPLPHSLEPYRATFGIAPRFGADFNQVSCPRAFLDQPMVGSDTVLGDILKEHATTLLRQIPDVDPLVSRVRHVLLQGFSDGRSGLTQAARALGMSPRTLRRRLAALGTSFHEIIDRQRHDLACNQLSTSDDANAQIAARLGFASVSTFQRAFRRWTGVAPSTYRERQRRAASSAK